MEIETNPRKIVALNYSFFVSLPIDWVRNHDLIQGDSVQPIIMDNGYLLLKPLRREVKEDDNPK